jgi:hypothetical protein
MAIGDGIVIPLAFGVLAYMVRSARLLLPVLLCLIVSGTRLRLHVSACVRHVYTASRTDGIRTDVLCDDVHHGDVGNALVDDEVCSALDA